MGQLYVAKTAEVKVVITPGGVFLGADSPRCGMITFAIKLVSLSPRPIAASCCHEKSTLFVCRQTKTLLFESNACVFRTCFAKLLLPRFTIVSFCQQNLTLFVCRLTRMLLR